MGLSKVLVCPLHGDFEEQWPTKVREHTSPNPLPYRPCAVKTGDSHLGFVQSHTQTLIHFHHRRMNEQLINDRIKLEDIKNQMSAITKVAREYAEATPEQRAKVNSADVQAVMDKYNQLKLDKAALEQSVVAQEMEIQKQAAEQAAKQIVNTRGTGRRYGG